MLHLTLWMCRFSSSAGKTGEARLVLAGQLDLLRPADVALIQTRHVLTGVTEPFQHIAAAAAVRLQGLASSAPVSSWRPSGLNVTELTDAVCPGKALNRALTLTRLIRHQAEEMPGIRLVRSLAQDLPVELLGLRQMTCLVITDRLLQDIGNGGHRGSSRDRLPARIPAGPRNMKAIPSRKTARLIHPPVCHLSGVGFFAGVGGHRRSLGESSPSGHGSGCGRTLQATALVNEAYLKMVDSVGVDWRDRAHFFAVSAKIMRRILVDAARMRDAGKRGGGAARLQLDGTRIAAPERDGELVAVDQALEELAKFDPRKAHVVELRFFGGLSVAETAEVLNVSEQTVLRDWKLARAWLLERLT